MRITGSLVVDLCESVIPDPFAKDFKHLELTKGGHNGFACLHRMRFEHCCEGGGEEGRGCRLYFSVENYR